jgi:hypothetical protein
MYEIPENGGDTLWASGYEVRLPPTLYNEETDGKIGEKAYDRLTPSMQKFLEGLTAVNDGNGFHERAKVCVALPLVVLFASATLTLFLLDEIDPFSLHSFRLTASDVLSTKDLVVILSTLDRTFRLFTLSSGSLSFSLAVDVDFDTIRRFLSFSPRN